MRDEQPVISWQYWCGVAFFVAVLLAISATVYGVYCHLSNRELRPMAELYVSGPRHYVLDAELQSALAELPEADNFFSLDVNEAKLKLEALPWVERVTVRKMWPDKLRVALQEQQVAARWNNAALLNRAGEIFDAPQQRIQTPLVALNGPDDQAAVVLQVYQELQHMLAEQALKIRRLHLSERHAWSAELENGVVLQLGQEDRINRMARFIALYPELDINAMAYVDLRYDTGFAVGWKQQQGLSVDDQSNG